MNIEYRWNIELCTHTLFADLEGCLITVDRTSFDIYRFGYTVVEGASLIKKKYQSKNKGFKGPRLNKKWPRVLYINRQIYKLIDLDTHTE